MLRTAPAALRRRGRGHRARRRAVVAVPGRHRTAARARRGRPAQRRRRRPRRPGGVARRQRVQLSLRTLGPAAGPRSLRPGPRSPAGSLASARRPRSSSAPSSPSPAGTGAGARQSRAGIVGGAAALSIVVAVGIFLTGIDHLYSIPTARGWAWDAVIGNVNFPLSDATVERLAGDPRIEAQTVSRVCAATVGGEGAEVLAVRPGGTAPPVLASGRLPASASEIALGARLARRLDAERGDLVRFSVAGGDCETEEPATRARADRGRSHRATRVRRVRHRAGRGRDARRRRGRRRERLNPSS